MLSYSKLLGACRVLPNKEVNNSNLALVIRSNIAADNILSQNRTLCQLTDAVESLCHSRRIVPSKTISNWPCTYTVAEENLVTDGIKSIVDLFVKSVRNFLIKWFTYEGRTKSSLVKLGNKLKVFKGRVLDKEFAVDTACQTIPATTMKKALIRFSDNTSILQLADEIVENDEDSIKKQINEQFSYTDRGSDTTIFLAGYSEVSTWFQLHDLALRTLDKIANKYKKLTKELGNYEDIVKDLLSRDEAGRAKYLKRMASAISYIATHVTTLIWHLINVGEKLKLALDLVDQSRQYK